MPGHCGHKDLRAGSRPHHSKKVLSVPLCLAIFPTLVSQVPFNKGQLFQRLGMGCIVAHRGKGAVSKSICLNYSALQVPKLQEWGESGEGVQGGMSISTMDSTQRQNQRSHHSPLCWSLLQQARKLKGRDSRPHCRSPEKCPFCCSLRGHWIRNVTVGPSCLIISHSWCPAWKGN